MTVHRFLDSLGRPQFTAFGMLGAFAVGNIAGYTASAPWWVGTAWAAGAGVVIGCAKGVTSRLLRRKAQHG